MYLDYGFSKPDFTTLGNQRATKTAREAFINESREDLKDATEEQLNSLAWYTGDGYFQINKGLYGITVHEDHKSTLSHMDSAMQESVKQSRVTYRGYTISSTHHFNIVDTENGYWEEDQPYERVTKEVGEHFYQVGSEVHLKGYTSTSQSVNIALDFVFDDDSMGVVYEIKSQDGLNISSVAYYPEEMEVLLPRDKKFTVVGKHYGKVEAYSGGSVVVVQLVETSDL